MTTQRETFRLPQFYWDAVDLGAAKDLWQARALGVTQATVQRVRANRKIRACRDKTKIALFKRNPYSRVAWHTVDWSKTNPGVFVQLKGAVSEERIAFMRRYRLYLAKPFLPTFEIIEACLQISKNRLSAPI